MVRALIKMHRRDFLTAGAALSASMMLPGFAMAEAAPMVTVRPAPAKVPLMGAGKPETAVWAYGKSVPGPVIRIPRAKPVHIRLENHLDQATTVHWHGIRLANAMDGVPGFTQSAVAPGAAFDYRFTAPDAGTYWYHSHEKSWEQVARGLYGPLIVEEDTPVAVDAEQMFIVDDWRLGEDGAIAQDFGALHDAAHGGRLGNWLTVNGVTAPKFDVRPGARIRLRCISAANARIMAFRFPGVAVHVIAVDGQPLDAPETLEDALLLAPAQRTDLVIDIPSDAVGEITIEEVSTSEPIKAATFNVTGTPLRAAAPAEMVRLPANPLSAQSLDLDGALNVDLVMQGGAMGQLTEATYQGQLFDMRTLVQQKGQVWAFNGEAGAPSVPLLHAALGRTVTINMINDTRWSHAMHLHGHHFQVIERDGQPVNGAPWRDTELLAPAERVRIAFLADNPGKWLFHCHMLEHHMAGMGTWINVG